MSDSAPQLAVVVPHFNDTRRLARCLEALEPQIGPEVEVVVADNASTDSLDEVRGRFPWARIVIQPEKGAGPARNAGIAATTAPWLAFIDADCIAAPDWVSHAKRIAAGDPGAVTGGRVDVFDETPPPRSGAEAFEAVFAFRMSRYLEEEAFLGAGNLVVSRRSFERAGPFRPAVSEDKEWSRRAASRGMRLAYDDALAVAHPSRSDWAALARKWRRLTSEEYRLGGSRLRWLRKALAMPASAVVHMPRILRAETLDDIEKARALVTLVRLRLARMIWMLALLTTRRSG